ncbi:MAG: S1 domain-containing RNA-binding protein [Clostridia bacterium]|jgi:S1 RNA binding domain protein
MPIEVGSIVEGVVSGITSFGAFIQLGEGKTGMVHISEIADTYVKDIHAYLKKNDRVKVKVLAVDPEGKISLSIRKAVEEKKSSRPVEINWSSGSEADASMSFEERMAKFLKESEERLSDVKRNRENKRRGGYVRGRSSAWE